MPSVDARSRASRLRRRADAANKRSGNTAIHRVSRKACTMSSTAWCWGWKVGASRARRSQRERRRCAYVTQGSRSVVAAASLLTPSRLHRIRFLRDCLFRPTLMNMAGLSIIRYRSRCRAEQSAVNTAGLAFGQPVGIPILPSRSIVHGARYARAIAVYTHDALRTYRVCCAHIALHVCAVSLSTLRATMVETQEGLTPFARTPLFRGCLEGATLACQIPL